MIVVHAVQHRRNRGALPHAARAGQLRRASTRDTARAAAPAVSAAPEELIDRYQIACHPIRDLLVDYLRERQPALDYTSLESLAFLLASVFWSDIERHHPGIDTLQLPAEVAGAWKQRLQTKTETGHRRYRGEDRDLSSPGSTTASA